MYLVVSNSNSVIVDDAQSCTAGGSIETQLPFQTVKGLPDSLKVCSL